MPSLSKLPSTLNGKKVAVTLVVTIIMNKHGSDKERWLVSCVSLYSQLLVAGNSYVHFAQHEDYSMAIIIGRFR